MTTALELGASPLSLNELRRLYSEPLPVKIHERALRAVRDSHAATCKLAAGEPSEFPPDYVALEAPDGVGLDRMGRVFARRKEFTDGHGVPAAGRR